MTWRFWKKPWEREPCLFEVQEIGPGGKGWHSITEPSAEPTTIKDAREHFTPGKSYRLLARSIERGSFVGVVWTHYEPHPAGTVRKQPEPKEKIARPPPQPSPTEYMKKYAEEVRDTLEPIGMLLQALQEFTGGLMPASPQPVQEQSLVGPLQFSGQAPWMMHPIIIREVADTVKDVTDHIFDRLSGLELAPSKRGRGKEEEEEEGAPLLPKATDYMPKPKPIPKPTVTPAPQPITKKAITPTPSEVKRQMSEKDIVPPEKTVPSLLPKTKKKPLKRKKKNE